MDFLKKHTLKNDDEDRPILQLKGLTGHIYLFKNRIEIKRLLVHKALRKNSSGNYSILLSDISEIQLKLAPSLDSGYIRFIEVGKDASYLSSLNRLIVSMEDDCTVMIKENNNDFVLRFIDRIIELEPSIPVLNMNDSEYRDVLDRINDAASSSKSFMVETVKEVDKKKLANTICDVVVKLVK